MTQTTTEEKLLDEKQTAARLNLSVALLRRWRAARKAIPFVRLGARRIGYRASDVARFISAHIVEPVDQPGESPQR
jgi:hypothetical protein